MDSWYHSERVDIYGLTGGIASGKSSIAQHFRTLGVPVIDADKLARDVGLPGRDALREIVGQFGNQVLREDGTLDRKTLGAIVFADAESRDALNKITHPRIAAASAQAMRALADEGEAIALYEAALIVENNLQESMQGLIVVTLPEEMQVERLMQRDGLDLDAAQERIRSQLPLADKVKVADYVIDNSGTRESTRALVLELWQKLNSR